MEKEQNEQTKKNISKEEEIAENTSENEVDNSNKSDGDDKELEKQTPEQKIFDLEETIIKFFQNNICN